MANIQINELSKSLKEYIESLCISVDEITELINTLSAPSNHNHDDNYYTETEIDSKLSEINGDMSTNISNLQIDINSKAPSNHNHDDVYYTETEINSKLTEINNTINTNVSNLQSGIDSHTHNYAGSSSAGGAANSVKTNLIIKLNGGTTEGTNLFTFNGSTAKTINITPSSIGAAADSHGTHLTLGTGSGNAFRGDYGNTAYNHSQSAHAPSNAQKNSDITKAEIEAKLTGTITSHAHNYAGSSSAGGTANSVNGLTLWTGTQAQYNALASKSDTTLYFIIE